MKFEDGKTKPVGAGMVLFEIPFDITEILG